MEKIRSYIGLNSFQLKILAIVTMMLDHIGAVFFPKILIFRIIGRISFPIFAFLVAEGFFHTSDVKKYITRLGVLAIVSEVPFDLLFYGTLIHLGHQNVFFTLCLAVTAMYWMNKSYNVVMKFGIGFLFLLLADVLHTDYMSMGVFLVFIFYFWREYKMTKYIMAAAANILFMGGIQIYGTLALFPISLYNGEEGKKIKKFFYLFYPVHIIILCLIRAWI